MIWFLYNLLLVLTSPLWVPWMWWRSSRRREAPTWSERVGNYKIARRKDRKRIWVHAVSVGEAVAARPVLRELRRVLPEYEVVITCTTSTGHEVVASMKGSLVDHVFYFPIDVPQFCMAALTRVEPAVVVIMETELWLNFLTAAKAVRAKTCIANGRISDRSFRRSKHLRFFYRSVFSRIDETWVQTETDAERAAFFGARNVKVLGNSKYDEVSATTGTDWRRELALPEGEPLVVVGSVRGEEEEDFVLSALEGVRARIVVAPRHPERGAALLEKAKQHGFESGLRTLQQNGSPMLILDTIGELAGLYSFANVAVIGGGFSNLGGQNLIQPMACGVPVVCGPHMQNFREPFEAGVRSGAVLVADTPDELREHVSRLLGDPAAARRSGDAGKAIVSQHVGASQRYAMGIASLAKDFEREHTR